MPLRISINHRGKEQVREFRQDQLLIGRPGGTKPPELDLSPDECVSRQHALIFVENNACWIKDLQSRYGTRINDTDIGDMPRCRVFPEDTVLIGETTLQIVATAAEDTVIGAGPQIVEPTPAPGSPAKPPLRIVQKIDTSKGITMPSGDSASAVEKRLTLLLDLPRQFAAQTSVDQLLQTVMTRVVEVVPSAKRGALLLRDKKQDRLLLKAYVSEDEPAVSETLARRVLSEKCGFIWRGDQGDPTKSVKEFKILSGMYAPVQWQEQLFGVICVDSPDMTNNFAEADLQFLIAIGQYAGMALAEQGLRADLQQNSKLTDRLLTNFSPKIRALLMDQAKLGRLRPGGTKSEVTVLFCDMVGFTRSAAAMDAADVVNMLNDYFQPLVDAIFRHDGTLDKFVGDGLLAVFGSPEPDPEQQLKAARAAVAMLESVNATSRLRTARGDQICQVRLGLHSGEAIHGFVGGVDRLEFTVVGDVVNRACRYCQSAGESEIFLSPEVFQRIFSQIRAEKTTAQTKEGELVAYRLKAIKD